MKTILNTINQEYPSRSQMNSQIKNFDPQKQSSQKLATSKNSKLKLKNIGHWTSSQKELYFIFVHSHKENFLKKELRRTDKIFKQMSRFIKSRAPDQCRSHHQKMEKKFSTLDMILNSEEHVSATRERKQILKSFQNFETKVESVIIPDSNQKKGKMNQRIQTFEELLVEENNWKLDVPRQIANMLLWDEDFNIENFLLL